MIRLANMEETVSNRGSVGCSSRKGTGCPAVGKAAATTTKETMGGLVEEHCVRNIADDGGGVCEHQELNSNTKAGALVHSLTPCM